MILSVLAFSLSAQITVEFADGSVEYKKGSAWLRLEMGAGLKNEDSRSVRLGKDSYAVFIRAGRRLSISAPGTYDLPLLFSRAAPTGAETAIATKIKTLVKGKSRGESVAAGVRGDRQGEAEFEMLDFVNEAEKCLDLAKLKIELERFTEAESDLALAKELFDNSGESSAEFESAVNLYSGMALAGQGKLAEAVKALRRSSYADAGAESGTYVILLSSLDIETQASGEARTLLVQARGRSAELAFSESEIEAIDELLSSLP